MTKLLWLDINCSYAHASLALPAIHAQADGNSDVSWDVISATTSSNVGAVVLQVVAAEPDIICATTWLFTSEFLLKVIARVKVLLPESVIVLGGPEFLGDNEKFLSVHAEVDCVFRGEGEEEFHKWLACYSAMSIWPGIRGLCWMEGSVYHDNGIARVADFEALNPPESSRFFNWSKPFVQLETARGCFNSCAFCVSGAEKPVRPTSLDSVRERVGNIHSRGIKEVRLLDRTFNGDQRRAIGILEVFSLFPDMNFHLEIHPSLLGKELREAMRNLPEGLLHLEAGIQSLDADVLRACGRAGELEKAMDGLRFLCGLGNVVVHTDLIAGLPHYTLRQIYDDIKMLASIGAGEIQLELLKLLPGTRMRNEASSLGIKYSPGVPYEVLCTDDSLTVAETQESRLLSRLVDMYYNSGAWHDITCKLILGEEGFLAGFLAWLRRKEYLEQPLSVAKRGLLLYEYIESACPAYVGAVTEAWVKAGLSVRKLEALSKS